MLSSDLLDKAISFDFHDKLKSFREQFVIDDPDLIYLDGNSLGRLPGKTKQKTMQVVEQEWGKDLISSWNKSWYQKSLELGNKIAVLIGAQEGEVIVSDNTSTNLYKLAFGALKARASRNTIVTDEFNFPSDVYILQGLARELQRKYDIQMVKSIDGISINDKDIKTKINDETALVTLSHVAFKSSFMYDMDKVTRIAHDHGALILWDLSHAVGAVPVHVNKCNIDLAIGCTYKYLNGGPGAPAFLYVRKDLQEKLTSPIQGWFGAKDPFDFSLDYEPAAGIHRFLTGTPPVLSLSGIELGLNVAINAGMENIRAKSIQLSTFFIDLFDKELSGLGFKLASPRNINNRGSHISIQHPEAFRIIKAMMDQSIHGKSIVPDFRAPDYIRFGFAPLYNTFEEIYRLVEKLKIIVSKKLYANYDDKKDVVT